MTLIRTRYLTTHKLMPEITLILGLCGSGKTYLAEAMKKKNPTIFLMDEGFNLDFDKNYKILIEHLREGKICIVIEIEFCYRKDLRELLEQRLSHDLAEVKIIWKCFENDIKKANQNVSKRKNKGDAKGHRDINSKVSSLYTFPDNAEVLPIVTEWE